jgi:methionyl aminopeptidase
MAGTAIPAGCIRRRGQARRRTADGSHLQSPDARHCGRAPGARTGAIGEAIQTYAEKERCSVVRDFCGHGVGKLFHDAPNILHYGQANEGPELKEGMIFTIEPMINLGRPHVKVLSDGWTAVTRDRSLSAQYEHSVGVTADGCEIFTLSPGNLSPPA